MPTGRFRASGRKPVMASSLPFRSAAARSQPSAPPCELGEHTYDVLADWLAIDDAEIGALERRGGFA